MTVGVSPSITATQLLVVPKSIPITVPIINPFNILIYLFYHINTFDY